MHFKIFTLFPELFPGPLAYSITGCALQKKLWSLETIDLRNYAIDKRGTVDDTPCGGGAGMVIIPEVVARALEENLDRKNTRIIYLSPRGKVFNQTIARNIASYLQNIPTNQKEIAIICGRYEGIDQRAIDYFSMEEISIGDYVVSGGEIAAFPFIDAILRNLEGLLGSKNSLDEESFGNSDECEFSHLLEYPQYTKPREWREFRVPDILFSGNHKNIKEWRRAESVKFTKDNRPDLYEKYCRSIKIKNQDE